MDYQTKRDMIKKAFKWREDKKKQSDDEFYAKTLLVFMFIISLSHLLYIYNNFNKNNLLEIKHLDIKYLDIKGGDTECDKTENQTSP
jgi:hypothetical protein